MQVNGQMIDSDDRMKIANERFAHLIARQLPVDFLNTRKFEGLILNEVRFEVDKLVVRVDSCFEAVFGLEFELPQEFLIPDEQNKLRTNYPLLLLYDFKLLMEEL